MGGKWSFLPIVKTINLDSLLTPQECAAWLGIAERTLINNVRRKKIPVVRINERVLRFHPRTILAVKGAKAA